MTRIIEIGQLPQVLVASGSSWPFEVEQQPSAALSTGIDMRTNWPRKVSMAFCALAIMGPGAARADFVENFDGVTPPALPAGWTATNASGPAPLWVTTATGSDSAPNNAFIDDPDDTADKRLDTPSIPIAVNNAVLTFRHDFDLQIQADGGVLEISIDGGAFQDILAAGGSFVVGGYNDHSFNGPLIGRDAWSGNSHGYITTTVNVPAAAAGKSIVLRFRMGSDFAFGGAGWHIDSLEIQSQDQDGDGAPNGVDTCPNISNVNQTDADGDGKGAACDNCPNSFNADQADADGDGKGDVCDNCPSAFNDDQADADTDGLGDLCEPPPDAACGACAQGAFPVVGLFLPACLFGWKLRRRHSQRR